ncbi:MAG TPA: NINE protein [Noviherbaspirillum sp.]|nr:NINE protein [Noviherbaspirillum sp.]
MTASHKNKTFATFLATIFGGVGLHRFYLHGSKDFWGWIHAATLALSLLLYLARPEQPLMFSFLPFVLSALAALLAALVIGLTADEQWDARHNPHSGRHSASGWPLAVLLVLAFGVGAIGLTATIARMFDLLYTGGAFG